MLPSFQIETELFVTSPVRVEPSSADVDDTLAEFRWDENGGNLVWNSTPQVV